MRLSHFTDEKKRQILTEKENEGITVGEICKRYRISIPTFYTWKRNLTGIKKIESSIEDHKKNNPSIENEVQILRRLYINLSAHNYELAKFLEK